MEPERSAAVARIARRLAAGGDWGEIDSTLEDFGFRTFSRWEGSYEDYVLRSLEEASFENIVALERHLAQTPHPADDLWEDDRFRLFISHVAKQRSKAHELRAAFLYFGVDGFVAHDEPRGERDWRITIAAALHTCHAVTALLNENFPGSRWCDQEVGIALGRGVPVIPVRVDLEPYGFLGAIPSIDGSFAAAKDVAQQAVGMWMRDKRTGVPLTEAMVHQLCRARSFEQANRLAGVLAEHAELVTRDQLERMRRAQRTNFQVERAFAVDRALADIDVAVSAREPAAS